MPIAAKVQLVDFRLRARTHIYAFDFPIVFNRWREDPPLYAQQQLWLKIPAAPRSRPMQRPLEHWIEDGFPP